GRRARSRKSNFIKIGARSQKLWPFEVSRPNVDFSSCDTWQLLIGPRLIRLLH
ncbi:hypothetical protein KI387_028514, partial [Taxus chinensis]